MLVAIVSQLENRWPDAQFIISGAGINTCEDIEWPIIAKLPMRKNIADLNGIAYFLPSWLRSFAQGLGFATEADIDLIVDASGFSYSDQWSSKLRIWHMKNELLRFKKYHKPYVFLPQAFGPFSDPASGGYIATGLPHAAMICARDGQSLDYIKEHTGALANLYQYGDFTNLIKAGELKMGTFSDQMACIVPNHNMMDAHNSNTGWLERYESLLLEVIACYKGLGLTPFFLNHEGPRDAQLIERINLQLEQPIRVLSDDDPLAVKGIIAASRAVFCSRYHGCVSALSEGIPCVGTSWSHKYDLLYGDYEVPELLLSPEVTVRQLTTVISRSVDIATPMRAHLRRKSHFFRRQSVDMWDTFFRIVEGYPVRRLV